MHSLSSLQPDYILSSAWRSHTSSPGQFAASSSPDSVTSPFLHAQLFPARPSYSLATSNNSSGQAFCQTTPQLHTRLAHPSPCETALIPLAAKSRCRPYSMRQQLTPAWMSFPHAPATIPATISHFPQPLCLLPLAIHPAYYTLRWL